MCGIAGVYNIGPDKTADVDVVRAMCRAMQHRGPDDEGVYGFGAVALGARRLAIIDVAAGHQPIANEAGTTWAALNGEIYNHRALRRFLQKQGHVFKTACDTEVLVHLYDEFAEEMLDHLEGIFSFAIWDSRRRRMFIARDPFGIKPLYYTEQGGTLIFASELKALLQHPDVPRELDIRSASAYMSFEYVPTPHTILKGIRRLKPGHYLLATDHGISTRQYWDLNLIQSESHPPVHWRDYATGLRDLISEVVRDELISDVPIGIFLSGGIDSSAIAAAATQHHSQTIDTFSVGLEDESFDESSYAQTVSRHLGTQHHELIFTSSDAKSQVPGILASTDEPFGDSSYIPTHFLSQLASGHVKVVLGGDGGDELFAGYPTLVAHRVVEQYARWVPWLIRARMIPKLIRNLPVSFDNISVDFKLKRFLAGRGVPHEIRHHRWLGSFYEESKQQLFQGWAHPVIGDTYKTVAEHMQTCGVNRLLNQILYLDAKLYLEGDILVKVDRASMAHSLEVRVPFLNKRIVDFVSRIPVDLKLKHYTSKYILKKAMAPLLPKQIIERPKKGFNIPVAKWINAELADYVDDMLAPGMLQKHGLFNVDYVQNLLQEHRAARKDHRKLIWTLLAFQAWYEGCLA